MDQTLHIALGLDWARVDANGSTVYPYIGDAAGTTTRCSGGNYSGYYSYQGEHSSFMFLDTPSGAGSHSYKIEWMQGYSGGYTSYIGRDQQGSQDQLGKNTIIPNSHGGSSMSRLNYYIAVEMELY